MPTLNGVLPEIILLIYAVRVPVVEVFAPLIVLLVILTELIYRVTDEPLAGILLALSAAPAASNGDVP